MVFGPESVGSQMRWRDGPDWVSGFQMETDMNFRTAMGSWSLRPPVTSVGGMIVGSQ